MAKKKTDPNHGFPGVAYLYWYHGLSAQESLEDCASTDERFVGVYKLIEVKNIVLAVTEKVIEK